MAKLVNRTKIGAAVDNDLLKKFQELAALTRIPQSKLLDEAIEDLLTKYEDKNRG